MKVLFVNSERIGQGDELLGGKLMASFFYALVRTRPQPDTVVLMNSGVRLACKGSAALEDLKLLAADGIRIYSCGTCLDFYRLKEQLAVGEVGNMNDTVSYMMSADEVVSIG